MVLEQAGGEAFDGQKSIFDIDPIHIRQRTIIYLGLEESGDFLDKRIKNYHDLILRQLETV